MMRITTHRLVFELSRALRDEEDSFASLIFSAVLALQLSSPLFLAVLNLVVDAATRQSEKGQFWIYMALSGVFSCAYSAFIRWDERRRGSVRVRNLNRISSSNGRVLVWAIYCACVFLQIFLYFEARMLGFLLTILVLMLPVFPADRVEND